MTHARRFDRYVGVDYSGRGSHNKRTSAIQIFESSSNTGEVQRINPTRFVNWSRSLLSERLIELLSGEERVIVGLDHGFSFPAAFLDAKGLGDWRQAREGVARAFAGPTIAEPAREEWTRGIENPSPLRLTERWTSSAGSVLAFQRRQGNVALSTHAGILHLHHILARLKQQDHRPFVWPFDGWALPASGCVIAEVYPSLFSRRFLEEAPSHPDQRDAWSVARWLQWVDAEALWSRYTDPPLSHAEGQQARREGWILGVA